MSDNKSIDIVLDMETGDPDDFLTLLLLLGHPRSNLKAVTMAPGTPSQVGLAKWACRRLGKPDMPVGAFDPDRKADCVSKWHYDVYGSIAPARPDGRGGEVLKSACGPGTTLVTGAPLHNLGVAMSLGLEVGEWVAQGGFAGEGVVPRERQLDKFKGMATCPTYNLNGDPKSALTALGYAGIGRRRFVSKNVCHGVFCDQTLGDAIGRRKGVPHLDLIHQGVKAYLGRHPEGKKFHDPLAACCALSPDIGEWAEVELYREKGQWGSRLKPGSGTLIIVGYDHRRFTETLLEARA